MPNARSIFWWISSTENFDLEHFHSTSHIKQPVVTVAQYCRDFATTLKENIKRLHPSTAFYYHTSLKKSWYQAPTISSDSYTPIVRNTPTTKPAEMSPEDQEKMISWAHEFGQAVRQLSNRQTTTMKKMGTLPDYMATRNLALQERVLVETAGAEDSDRQTDSERDEEENESGDSDREHSDKDDATDSEGDFEPPTIFEDAIYDQRPAYLTGAVSRSGRAIKLNNIYTDILR